MSVASGVVKPQVFGFSQAGSGWKLQKIRGLNERFGSG
jgi:hypothetical protein